MSDDIRFLHLCGRLMTGKNIGNDFCDAIKVDNMLYADFGMSSEDILQKFVCINIDNATIIH